MTLLPRASRMLLYRDINPSTTDNKGIAGYSRRGNIHLGCLVPGVGPRERKHEAQGYTYLRRGNIHFMSAWRNKTLIRREASKPCSGSVMPENGNSSRLNYAAAGATRRAECNSLPRSYSQASGDSTTILGTVTPVPSLK